MINYKKNSIYLLVSLLFLSPIVAKLTSNNIGNIENNITNDKDEADQTCSICMDNVGNSGLSLNCKHNFHEHCLRSWLEINNRCPICRKEFSEADLHDNKQDNKDELFEQIRNYFNQFGSEDVNAFIDNCYNDPYLLLGDECQCFLTDEMKNVVNQFLQAEYPENNLVEKTFHKPLTGTGLILLKELSDSFEQANNAEVDSLLIEATNNPMILVDHSWFTRMLNQNQRDLVGSIIDIYTNEELI